MTTEYPKTKAVILAAGFGTRMKEYTRELPKPMLPMGKIPLMEYTIRQLVANGITHIGINLHYLADKITEYFQDGEAFGAQITYLYESTPSGTAGGVKKLENFCKETENLIVIYGDIITDLNYDQFVKNHIANNKLATICVHRRKKSNSIIEFDNTMTITSFIERPDEETLKKQKDDFWVNSAIYCFKPKILELIQPNIEQDFPKDIFPNLIKNKELCAFCLNAKRFAIDSEEKYLEAVADIENFNFSFKL